jgi:hypothetical protein
MMNVKLIQPSERLWQRPLSLILLLSLAFGVAGWVVVSPLIMATPLAQATWVLAQVAWRVIPPFIWLALGGTAVFWLWLLRRLWQQTGVRAIGG